MKRTFYALMLVGCLSGGGCEASRWAVTKDPTGHVPLVEAVKEGAGEGLSLWAEGGILAGVLGFAATTFKSLARKYRDANPVPGVVTQPAAAPPT